MKHLKIVFSIVIVLTLSGFGWGSWNIIQSITPPVVSDAPPAADGFIGNLNDSGNLRYIGANQLFFTTYTVVDEGTISECDVFIGNGTGSNFNVAIYSSDGQTKLAESDLQVAGATGMHNFILDSPVDIEVGTDYRLAVGTSDDGNWYLNYQNVTVGFNVYYDNVGSTVGDTMPATCDISGTLQADDSLLIRFDNGQ